MSVRKSMYEFKRVFKHCLVHIEAMSSVFAQIDWYKMQLKLKR